jgi:23S rRNA (adenine2503-C2)-methyltransferase
MAGIDHMSKFVFGWRSKLNSLVGMTRSAVYDLMLSFGAPKFRGDQILNWLYRRNSCDIQMMTNLPAGFRQKLIGQDWQAYAVTVHQTHHADDGTERFLFYLSDGECVEGVYLPERDRDTVCLSSQVGCGIGCAFCATGQSGLVRNLTASEMVDSVRQISIAKSKRISHVVVMGQGEPFSNYEQLLKALEIINADYGMGLAARHITVSTAGIIPRILDFAKEKYQYNLAISLHATDNNLRDRLIPLNKKYPLEELRRAAISYTKETNRRVTLEYLMIEGINDGKSDLKGLIDFSKGWLCHINLIRYHAVPGKQWKASSTDALQYFLKELSKAGVPASLRRSRGEEVAAACGQLRQEVLKRQV